jgi:hypothetical protein
VATLAIRSLMGSIQYLGYRAVRLRHQASRVQLQTIKCSGCNLCLFPMPLNKSSRFDTRSYCGEPDFISILQTIRCGLNILLVLCCNIAVAFPALRCRSSAMIGCNDKSGSIAIGWPALTYQAVTVRRNSSSYVQSLHFCYSCVDRLKSQPEADVQRMIEVGDAQ